MLTKIDPKMSGINEEASMLWVSWICEEAERDLIDEIVFRLENNMEGFREQAKKCVKESLSQVYNPPLTEDPHYITFSPYNSEIHDPIRQKIYEPKVEIFLLWFMKINKLWIIYYLYLYYYKKIYNLCAELGTEQEYGVLLGTARVVAAFLEARSQITISSRVKNEIVYLAVTCNRLSDPSSVCSISSYSLALRTEQA